MFRGLILKLALRNLRSDWFGTLCAIVGVALGTATVDVVLTLDLNTRAQEAGHWSTDPDLPAPSGPQQAELIPIPDSPETQASNERGRTVDSSVAPSGKGVPRTEDAKEETHEDYQVMRSAIRLGSLSAFLVGALIVFFTFRVVIAQRRREIALLRSLGTTKAQVAAIFLTEAALIGLVGAAVGFAMTPPIALLAARAGISTTGRSQLHSLFFPLRLMMVVGLVGAATAVLGVLRPLQDILRLDVASALQPRAVAPEGSPASVNRGYGIIALPFMVLLYVLVRPFFRELLPSLAFFVLESGAVCFGFMAMLVLVPRVLGAVGAVWAALVPIGPRAERLLTLRRIQRSGHELSWSVSGVMMVFALLLALHILTFALKGEVGTWASRNIEQNAYLVARHTGQVVAAHEIKTPPEVIRVRYSGRTPGPNTVRAVDVDGYRAFATATNAKEDAIGQRFGPGRAVLSHLMARRLRLKAGDTLRLRVGNRQADLQIAGVSDLGYTPILGTYRSAKTFVLIAADDFPIIAEIVDRPMGGTYAFKKSGEQPAVPGMYWHNLLGPQVDWGAQVFESGADFMQYRLVETDADFVIFDLILLLTAALAAIGIANSLVLAAHVRRREIALFRVLGMTANQVRRLFVIEGLFIGAVGGVMAALLGAPLGYLTIGALRIISAFDVEYHLPVRYIVYIIVGAIAVAFTSAIYPALRAGRQSSTESLKYE